MSQYNDEDLGVRWWSDGINRYFAYFYKVVDGYRVECLWAEIDVTGNFLGVEKVGFQTEFERVKIDSELEKTALELKLKDIYGDAYQRYSYPNAPIPSSSLNLEVPRPTLISNKGEIYVYYHVSVELRVDGRNPRYYNGFIIPLDMISNN